MYRPVILVYDYPFCISLFSRGGNNFFRQFSVMKNYIYIVCALETQLLTDVYNYINWIYAFKG